MKRADALVLFGITGNLAYKMLLPALYQLTADGVLDQPIVGVAKTDLDLAGLRSRAREACEAKHDKVDHPAFEKFAGNLRLVAGDYTDGATFDAIRSEVGDAGFLTHYL